jgi:hypothetical protein
VRGEFPAGGLDGEKGGELRLEAVGVAAGELFGAARLGFCFACWMES